MNAIIFPGQGAQYPGMGNDLYDAYPQARAIFSRMEGVLGFSLSAKCFKGTRDELKDTSLAQLAIMAASLAGFEVLKSKGFKADYLAGLSLGEYSCLYPAGVLSLEDLTRLVRERGRAMQEAALNSNSTMLAVLGLEKEQLEPLAVKCGFYIANLNAPGQVVISLAKTDVGAVRATLEALPAKVISLEVSGGFHSPFVAPAKKRLEKIIDSLVFKGAAIPVVSNFTGQAHTMAGEIKVNLLEQLTSPVRWVDCVRFMVAQGVSEFYEVGPSKVLKGLLRKIDPRLKVVNIEKKEDLDNIKGGI